MSVNDSSRLARTKRALVLSDPLLLYARQSTLLEINMNIKLTALLAASVLALAACNSPTADQKAEEAGARLPLPPMPLVKPPLPAPMPPSPRPPLLQAPPPPLSTPLLTRSRPPMKKARRLAPKPSATRPRTSPTA